MLNESQTIEFQSKQNGALKATSTVTSAFSDPFNWMMIVVAAILLVIGGIATLGRYDSWLPNIIALCVFAFAGWFLYRYIRAILNREIEVAQDGVYYREASRRLFFTWDKIQKVKLEPHYKQITFWQDDKLQRIHEFGLPWYELALVREALVKQLVLRNIPFVGNVKTQSSPVSAMRQAEKSIQQAFVATIISVLSLHFSN